MKFVKMHGAGNDFVVVDARRLDRDWPSLARALCHRRFGVGADGLILVVKSGAADLGMRMFNPDGSEAEACGNGLRCLAKFAIERGLIQGSILSVETLAGVRQVEATLEDGLVVRSRVGLGMPRFAPDQIPMAVEKVDKTLRAAGPVQDYPILVQGRELRVTCLSLGNPHAVHFLGSSVADFPLAELGPQVEHHPLFPKRVNFEVARILAPGKIEARAWERGAGETLACGSGAGAIAVAARLHGWIGNKVDITLPGGTLTVDWDSQGEVFLTGPAEAVFEGEWGE